MKHLKVKKKLKINVLEEICRLQIGYPSVVNLIIRSQRMESVKDIFKSNNMNKDLNKTFYGDF